MEGSKSTRVAANRAYEVLSRIYSWARRHRGLRKLIRNHPVEGVEKFVENPRSQLLSADQLGAVLVAVEDDEPKYRDATWWLALHGCRSADVYSRQLQRGMEWGHIDEAEREWTKPITKTAPHLVPLTDKALEVLARAKAYRADETFVFPRLRWDGLAKRIRRGVGFDFAPKDLRTTMATGMQRLGILPDIIDRVQGRDRVGPSVRRHYQFHSYLPEKREALEKWHAYVLSVYADAGE